MNDKRSSIQQKTLQYNNTVKLLEQLSRDYITISTIVNDYHDIPLHVFQTPSLKERRRCADTSDTSGPALGSGRGHWRGGRSLLGGRLWAG